MSKVFLFLFLFLLLSLLVVVMLDRVESVALLSFCCILGTFK